MSGVPTVLNFFEGARLAVCGTSILLFWLVLGRLAEVAQLYLSEKGYRQQLNSVTPYYIIPSNLKRQGFYGPIPKYGRSLFSLLCGALFALLPFLCGALSMGPSHVTWPKAPLTLMQASIGLHVLLLIDVIYIEKNARNRKFKMWWVACWYIFSMLVGWVY